MIVLGRITAPFGIRGWLKIHAFGDDPEAWASMPRWWLASDLDEGLVNEQGEALGDIDWQPYDIKECTPHGKGLVVSFSKVTDRNTAETIIGYYIAVPREELPKVTKGEYYWGDLVGLEVVNLAGESLGQVEKLLSTGAHEVLCVRSVESENTSQNKSSNKSPSKKGASEKITERLLPFVESVVKEVDVATRKIRVDWELDW